MAEKKKKFPSLPSNYVTLQQLQERRLKEQEQRQKEKEREEEEQRRKLLEERRLKEEQEMERDKEEERNLHEIQRAQAIEAKASGRSNRRKPRNLSEIKRRMEKEIGSEMQKGGGGGGVDIGIAADGRISDEGQKPEESKQKKKNRKKHKKKTLKWKSDAESEGGVLVQSQAENGQEGNQIPVEPKEKNKRVGKKNKKMEAKMKEEEALSGIVEKEDPEHGDKERITDEYEANDKAARASGVKKESVAVTVKVVKIAGELAVADHHGQEEENHGGSMTLRAGNQKHYVNPKYRRGSGQGRGRGRGRALGFGHGGNIRDGGQMWIKKGENSDGNGIQNAEAKLKAKAPCVS